MRIGVFGGTFDPVHVGHLILAEQCREQAGLDRVVFIPAARPPHKLDYNLTPFAQRVEMLALAIAGHAAFQVDEIEGGRAGPSYTADTLVQLKSRMSEAELFLVLGSDALRDLPQWHEPQHIVSACTLLVAARASWEMIGEQEMRSSLKLPAGAPLRLQMIHMPAIGIASRDLRRRTAEGRSLRFLVPRAVEVYIAEKKLYVTSSRPA
jgi:nicotinate-nucleotide adenylyltransferase